MYSGVATFLQFLTIECFLTMTTQWGCAPGPKSGNDQFDDSFDIHDSGRWGEGCSSFTRTAGVPLWTDSMYNNLDTNTRDTLPTVSLGSKSVPPSHRPVQKRAYKRACRRAIEHGYAWYHGQSLTVQDFPAYLVERCRPVDPKQNTSHLRPNQFHSPCNRLKIVQWNASGMSLVKQDDVIAWLLQQSVDIMIIAETRWQFTNDWKLGHWAIINGGDAATKGCGVMVLINTKRFASSDIGWTSILDGRILHVRIHQHTRPIDILACYQFVDDGPKKHWNHRQQFWQQLDNVLHKLPNRNMLILAGDFNCGVVPLKGQVGSATFQWRGAPHEGQRHRDTGTFMQIVNST